MLIPSARVPVAKTTRRYLSRFLFLCVKKELVNKIIQDLISTLQDTLGERGSRQHLCSFSLALKETK